MIYNGFPVSALIPLPRPRFVIHLAYNFYPQNQNIIKPSKMFVFLSFQDYLERFCIQTFKTI